MFYACGPNNGLPSFPLRKISAMRLSVVLLLCVLTILFGFFIDESCYTEQFNNCIQSIIIIKEKRRIQHGPFRKKKEAKMLIKQIISSKH